jgi:hypothetical protein
MINVEGRDEVQAVVSVFSWPITLDSSLSLELYDTYLVVTNWI